MTVSLPPPRRRPTLALALVAGACVAGACATWACGPAQALQEPPHSAELDAAIVRASKRHGVPESLIRRIIMRESKYVANARNRAYWGLMQISVPTARSMGFRGPPEQLLNPFVNLQYAVPYLANAFVVAGKQQEAAVRLYAAGYYFTAKTRGVLGALRTADSVPLNGVRDEPTAVPVAAAAPETGWSLFGSSPAPAAAPTPAPQPASQQQLAYAAAPEGVAVAPGQAQIQAIAPAPARDAAGLKTNTKITDKNASSDVDMVAGRDGALAPPKRWQHDGGTTVMARGEQGAEVTAAARLGDATAPSRHGRHAHKNAVFAQIEPGPAGRAPTASDAQ